MWKKLKNQSDQWNCLTGMFCLVVQVPQTGAQHQSSPLDSSFIRGHRYTVLNWTYLFSQVERNESAREQRINKGLLSDFYPRAYNYTVLNWIEPLHLNLHACAMDWCTRFAGSRGEHVSWVAGRARSCISLVPWNPRISRRQDRLKRSLPCNKWSNKSQAFAVQTQDSWLLHFLLLWTAHLEFTPARL